MSKIDFPIDISKSKRKEDLIEIKLRNEDVVQFNFSKLVYQSKYIRDKYNYTDALYSIQLEIEDIERKMNISEESIKLFIELVEEEKVNLPIEHYKDIYTLSEHFCTPAITAELDNINREKLFNDLNFTIQILQDYKTSNNGFETKLISKIENFLIKQINECIKNPKFRELEISTIFRIFEQSHSKFDHNLLVDFILESAGKRYIMLKLVELDKLREDKVDELINFFDELDETTKKMYSEYMPLNLTFIKNIRNKYNQILEEMNQIKMNQKQTKQELDKTKQELNEAKQESNQTKQELNQKRQEFDETNQELNETKQELNQTKQELNEFKRELKQAKDVLNQTKQELAKTKQELSQTKHGFDETKQELNQFKRELKQAKNVLNQTKNKKDQYTQSIIVGGFDKFYGIGEKPNSKRGNESIISPPVNLSFDPSSLLSYSTYECHSVLVMSDGSLKGIGNNHYGQISSTLQKTVIDHFTDFSIKDSSGRKLTAVSAVCYFYGTLYMFSKRSGSGRQLVLCDFRINGGNPVFLGIGNHHPVSLFGGYSHSAAIGSEGEVIFINYDSIKKTPNSLISVVSLPDGEKASSIACCDDLVVVLSSNGRVFTSRVESNGILNFSIVSELSSHEIVSVSGTYKHFLAVSNEGRVFGLGSNDRGQLCLGKGTESVSSFTEISSLARYGIRAAYAGYNHSLFETCEGKILSCGRNYYGQLLLSSSPSENVYSATETTINSGAAFCIVGDAISVVFIGSSPPPNTPNMRVHEYK